MSKKVKAFTRSSVKHSYQQRSNILLYLNVTKEMLLKQVMQKKKKIYITTDDLRKVFSRETFKNRIVSGTIELLPNSAPGDME